METPERRGEYDHRGDYHRHLDPDWSYAPIYKQKVKRVDRFVSRLPAEARILDAGAGEGVLVGRYRSQGYDCRGVDTEYSSELVEKGSVLSLPFENETFHAVLCLDVLEHINLLEQPLVLREIRRVLVQDGMLLLSVPNLAHLHSRIKFLLSGDFTRTSSVDRHPGDRPVSEVLELLRESNYRIVARTGIFPTAPFLFRLVNRHPRNFGWMVPVLDRLLPVPGWCFLNVIEAKWLQLS